MTIISYFWTVVRQGSLAAASRLSLAPSTVSAQPGKLAETMAGKLLHRPAGVLTDVFSHDR